MITCKVAGGMGKPATAAISIPANDYAHKLEKRTLVHIFFYENSYELGTQATVDAQGNYGNIREINLDKRLAEKKSGKAAQLMDVNDIMNWKLLFSGEVMGYGFSKIGAIRSINLMCSDFSSYWNMAQMYWGGKVNSDTYKRAIFAGATRLYHGPKTKVGSTDALIKILRARPSGHVQPEGILGGLVSLLESATGVFSPGVDGKPFRGVNDMMSFAELKYHLTRTIGASDRDETASIFMSSSMFNKWLRQVGKSVKYTASYMQVVTAILPHVHYEWNSVPAPPYVPAAETGLAKHQWVPIEGVSYKGSSLPKKLREKASFTKRIVEELYNRTTRDNTYLQDISYGFDPMLYQDNAGTLNQNTETYAKQHITRPGTLADWKTAAQLRKMGLDLRLEMEKKSHGSRTVKRQAVTIQDAFNCAAKAVEICNTLKTQPTSRHKDTWDRLSKELDCVKKKAQTPRKPMRRKEMDGEAANSRLHMHLFRPDLYMCPPPKCNVLFPDMIQSIQYTRNWMSEVTRLWLFTRNSSGKSMQNMYFAPTTTLILGAEGSDKPNSASEAIRNRTSFHMNHERYSGIVPVFEAVHDWAQMKKAYRQNVGKDDEFKDVPNAYLVRAANFMFFKRRFGARTMSLTCRFAPQLVAGLPCLVLDPVEKDSRGQQTTRFDIESGDYSMFSHYEEDDEDKQEFTGNGTHYFGVIHHIEHIADASGGAQTRILLTHCRTHEEGPDLFSGGEDLSTWTFKSITTKRKKGTVKSELLGGGNGNVDVYNNDWEDLLGTSYNPRASYTAEVVKTSTGSNSYTTFEAGHRSKIENLDSLKDHPRADVGEITGNAGTDADGDGSVTNDTEYRVPAVELKVYEIRKGRKASKVNFTFEGMVTPPWYSNVFYPDNIGEEYYSDMIGCRSVVDDPAIILSEEMQKKHKALLEEDESNQKKGDKHVDMVQIHNNHPQYSREKGIYEPSTVFVPKSLLMRAKSSRYAARHLAETWLGYKRMGVDINLYMDTYVDRAYATMLDIFGNVNENAYDTMFTGSKGTYGAAGEVRGFHGYAFGMFENLDNLEGAEQRLAVSTDKEMKMRAVKPQIDTRRDKHLRVRDYKSALLRTSKDQSGSK